MTTIAWDGKILAVDSQITCGEMITGYHTKLVVTDYGCASACGNLEDMTGFLKWVVDGMSYGKLPRISENFTGVVVTNGELMEYNSNLNGSVVDHQAAWGTGDELATAAMDFGKNAVEAVEYAATRNIYTGGNIDYYEA